MCTKSVNTSDLIEKIADVNKFSYGQLFVVGNAENQFARRCVKLMNLKVLGGFPRHLLIK